MANFPSQARFAKSPIPVSAGIGLKFEHIHEIIEQQPTLNWVEVHAENFMSDGGPSIRALEIIRENYPVSVHGVGLSIGSADSLDKLHLDRLKKLVQRFEPGLVSEHLAWSHFEGHFLNDLLPLPYNTETLQTVIQHVNQVQDVLNRQILIENPSLYLTYNECEMSEPEFLKEIADRTGCGLLLDVNNVYVSASNLNFDPQTYFKDFALNKVQEIHLAGHHERLIGGQILRIDDHGSRVCQNVWDLYSDIIGRVRPVPTLIEWDTNVPTLKTLQIEASIADQVLSKLEILNASAS